MTTEDDARTTAAEGGGMATAPLSEGERNELERLRAENRELRSQSAVWARSGGGQARRWRSGWHTPVATILIVIGCLLAPLSVLAVWTANQVSDTNRYVANVAPLISEPPIQRALTDQITNQITSNLNIPSLAKQAGSDLTAHGMPRVGNLLNTFSGQISGAVAGFIHGQVARIVTGQAVANLWVQVNRTAHAAIVKVLSGQGGGAISNSNGQVVIDLGPFIDDVKKTLSAQGFTLINQLPAIHPTFALFKAKNLSKGQTAYRLINDLKFVLPILCLLCLGLGIYSARRHRRALLAASLGFAAAMLVLAIGLQIARGIYLNSVPQSVLPSDAAAALFDTLVRFIKDGLRILLVLGLLVALGAFFTGPSTAAVRTRAWLASSIGRLRRASAVPGLRAGPAGSWTYDHRTALRIGAVAMVGLIFVFWPSAVTAIVLAVILLLILGLIEMVGRPSAAPVQPD